jgi:DNA-binding response OmpR family regulator
MQSPYKKILIIEDDDLFFTALKSRLVRHKLIVDRAKDGKEGLAKAKRHTYLLIVTDVVLPKMNGFEVIRILKDDYKSKTNFMVISNLGVCEPKSSKEVFDSLGISEYLIKSKHSITDITSRIIKCIL